MSRKKILNYLLVLALMLSVVPVQYLWAAQSTEQPAADGEDSENERVDTQSVLTDENEPGEVSAQQTELRADTRGLGTDSLIVHYDMSHDGDSLTNMVADIFHGTLVGVEESDFSTYNGSTTWTLDGGGYASLPSGIIDDETITISITTATVKKNNQWAWAFGTNSWYYTFFTPSNGSSKTKYTIASQVNNGSTGAWAAEKNILLDAVALDGSYVTYTVVIDGSTTQLYIDGVLAGTGEKPYSLMDIIPGSGIIGYIGKSLYNGDPLYNGRVSDFKIYSDALTAEQIAETIEPDYSDNIKADIVKDLLNGNEDIDNITKNVAFPATVDGVSVTWGTPSDLSVIDTDGNVNRPIAADTVVSIPVSFTYNGNPYNMTIELGVKVGKKAVVSYDMTLEDGKFIDITGNGFDAAAAGITASDITTDGDHKVMNFTGNKSQYIELPEGIINGESFTIETKMACSTAANHWLYCLGTGEGVWPNVKNYIFLNPMQSGSGNIRSGVKDSSIEILFPSTPKLDTGKTYQTITVVFEDGTMTLYLNGEKVSQETYGYSISQILADGTTSGSGVIGYIGKSLYTVDSGFVGQLLEFTVYNYALGEQEIIDTSDAGKVAAAKNELVLPYTEPVMGNITLPDIHNNGAVITWTTDHPEIVDVDEYENEGYDPTPAGVIIRPDGDTDVKLTANISYGIESDTKEFEITVKAKADPVTEGDYAGYLFTYFAGEKYSNGEQIYFASSEDGLNWEDLNYNEPVITSTLGEKGVRDPFIIRSPEGDKFYMIATDLKINNGNGWTAAQEAGSQSIMVWESTDLVNWSDQRMVKVALDEAGCTWAPEATYDKKTGEYIVYWASKVKSDGYAKQRIYSAKTRDFYTFTEPEIYIEKENHVIDTTIIEYDGSYYRYSKDETNARINIDKVSTLLYDTPVSISSVALSAQAGVEGPAIFKFNGEDKWCLLIDKYGSTGYYPLVTTDLASGEFEVLTTGYTMPSKARHGTPIPITQEEYAQLQQKWGAAGSDEEPQDDPVLEYNFEASDGATMIDSANDYDGSLEGNALIQNDGELDSNVLYLDGTSGTFAQFPTGFFDKRDTFTLSMDVKSEMNSENFFTFAMGQDTTQYMIFRTRANEIRSAVTTGSWSAEEGISYATPQSIKGTWVNVKIVVDSATMKMYVDGVLVDTNTSIATKVSDFGRNVIAYLGKSFYSVDNFFKGYFDNIKVYNRELTQEEIAAEFGIEIPAIQDIHAEGYCIITKDIDADTKQATLYISRNNSSITDLSVVPLSLTLRDGIITEGNFTADLTSPVSIGLTDENGSKQTWIIEAVLCNNPVLPGEFADPDIDIFDGKYYIYPTTDGYAGWSGTEFHVFSSIDMIDWVDEGIILDVATDAVPWAVGSAWAPTIEEKDGTYYFYFCAKRQDGASCIGVATSGSPTGPFTAQDTPLITPELCTGEGISMGQTIDPSIFTDDDGTSYMLFGNGNAAVAQLTEDMKGIVSGTMKNYSGATDFREAITVTKRDGTYHFTWSCDDTGSANYKVNYGTSDSIYGPITFQNTILSKDANSDILGTGHHSIVQIPGTDDYYIVYHRFVTPLGKYTSGYGYHRETCIDRLSFDETTGLMNTVTPTLEGILTPVLLNSENPGGTDETDNTEETQDTEETEDTEETQDTEETEDTKETQETGETEDTNKTSGKQTTANDKTTSAGSDKGNTSPTTADSHRPEFYGVLMIIAIVVIALRKGKCRSRKY